MIVSFFVVGCDVCERKSEMIIGFDVIFCLDLFFFGFVKHLSCSEKKNSKNQVPKHPQSQFMLSCLIENCYHMDLFSKIEEIIHAKGFYKSEFVSFFQRIE
ncbi:hypothetical protein CsSME_00022891 [Camellia sinensis var. sinensis]